MNALSRLKPKTPLFCITLVIAYVELSPVVRAVVPPPDGGYPNFNTAEGTFSLLSLTTGSDNTALGARALQNNTSSSYNTAVGYGTLFSNQASLNTAAGFDALFRNTTGAFNTATGARTLENNTTGAYNTADGVAALFSNTGPGQGCDGCGSRNTAVGAGALFANHTGYSNTAVGTNAIFTSEGASNNTAVGDGAIGLHSANGGYNTAVGASAMSGTLGIGSYNTAIGFQAGTAGGFGGPGDYNIAVGAYAGRHAAVDYWNIDIGNIGTALDSNTIRLGTQFDASSGNGQNRVFIAGIVGTTIDNGVPVVVDTSTGQLGVLPSSQRFKAEIKTMDKASEAILALRPVTFCYETSNTGTPQFGLVAEEVEKVNPGLVTRDRDGKPYTVRYDVVNAMLLNEFLKEHKAFVEEQRKVHEQEATIALMKSTDAKQEAMIAKQQKQIDALITGLQKVSAQIERNNPVPRTVLNDEKDRDWK